MEQLRDAYIQCNHGSSALSGTRLLANGAVPTDAHASALQMWVGVRVGHHVRVGPEVICAAVNMSPAIC